MGRAPYAKAKQLRRRVIEAVIGLWPRPVPAAPPGPVTPASAVPAATGVPIITVDPAYPVDPIRPGVPDPPDNPDPPDKRTPLRWTGPGRCRTPERGGRTAFGSCQRFLWTATRGNQGIIVHNNQETKFLYEL
jgi:hypothetical protein